MERFEVLGLTDENRWLDMFHQVGIYDIYHLPVYHRLSEISDEGKGILITYTKDDLIVLFPLIVRMIANVPGLEITGQGWYDAVSVYGYSGPVASRALTKKEKVQYYASLMEYFDSAGIVSVFSSIHPLLGQAELLEGYGDLVPTAPTISIDLTLPKEIQWNNYRKRYKSKINQLKKLGYSCYEDKEKEKWDIFIDLYYELMRELNASPYYFFPMEYFSFLKNEMNDFVNLFICLHEGEVIHSAIVTCCNDIVQYHLVGAVKGGHKAMSPGKLLIDTVRLWGIEKKARSLHLGRGLGGAKDSLLHFKEGFSKQENTFWFWRFIANINKYQQFSQTLAITNFLDVDNNYFPIYRKFASHRN
jgi:hypothetical protein